MLAEGICIACNLGTKELDDGTVDYSSIINIDIYNVSKPGVFLSSNLVIMLIGIEDTGHKFSSNS